MLKFAAKWPVNGAPHTKMQRTGGYSRSVASIPPTCALLHTSRPKASHDDRLELQAGRNRPQILRNIVRIFIATVPRKLRKKMFETLSEAKGRHAAAVAYMHGARHLDTVYI